MGTLLLWLVNNINDKDAIVSTSKDVAVPSNVITNIVKETILPQPQLPPEPFLRVEDEERLHVLHFTVHSMLQKGFLPLVIYFEPVSLCFRL
jgi:hypothetical protein